MAAPIELIRGGERQTVYSTGKADAALADGWQRVSDLTPEQQRELADRPPLPWKGYDEQTAHDIIAQAKGLPPERIKEIIVYESAMGGRVSIIGKLTGAAPVQSAPTPVVPRRTQRAAPDDGMPVTVETVTEAPLKTIETVQIVDAGDAQG